MYFKEFWTLKRNERKGHFTGKYVDNKIFPQSLPYSNRLLTSEDLFSFNHRNSVVNDNFNNNNSNNNNNINTDHN